MVPQRTQPADAVIDVLIEAILRREPLPDDLLVYSKGDWGRLFANPVQAIAELKAQEFDT